MNLKLYLVLAALLTGLMLHCSTKKDIPEMKVHFSWNPPCTGLDINPEIKIADIPSGTVQFYVGLIDMDLPAFDHGGGFAPYESRNIIPVGAVQGSYKGPSPPYGIIHTYQITVEALDQNKKVLGVGSMKLRYPPQGEEEAYWRVCDGKGS